VVGEPGVERGAEYGAFVSYSHDFDRDTARLLEAALEHFPAPRYRPRRRRVYLDSGDLPATADLPEALKEALLESGHLIVIASPQAGESRWVRQEVDWWLDRHGSPDKIIVVRSAGTFQFDPAGGVAHTDALPPRLAAALRHREPKVLTLPRVPGSQDLDTGGERWTELVADIVARLDGVAKDELIGEHIRNGRRWRQLRVGATSLLCLLLVASVVATVIAIAQRDEARTQQRIAIARLLMVRAQAALVSDPQTALRLAEAAEHLNPDAENAAGLVRLVRGTAYAGTLAGPGGHGNITSVTFTRDGRKLAAATGDGTITLWDTADVAHPRQVAPPFAAQADTINELTFSPSGTVLITGDNGGGVVLWDVRDPAHPRPWGDQLENGRAVTGIAVTADGTRLLCGLVEGTLRIWDIRDPMRPQIQSELQAAAHRLQAMALSADGAVLAAADSDGTVTTWTMADPLHPTPLRGLLTVGTAVDSLALSRDGQVLVTGGADAVATVWDLPQGNPVRLGVPVADGTAALRGVAISPDGATVTAPSMNGANAVWDIATRTRTAQFLQPDVKGTNATTASAAHPDGAVVAIGGVNGDVVLWTVHDPAQPQPMDPPLADPTDTNVEAGAYSADSRHLLTASRTTLHVWDLTDPVHPQTSVAAASTERSSLDVFAVSGDRRLLATAGPQVTISTLDGAGRPSAVGAIPRDPSGSTWAIALGPVGELLATATVNGTVLLYDLTTPADPRPLGAPLTGFPERVNAVAFSPDGKTLVGASEAAGYRGPGIPPPGANQNGRVILWDVTDPGAPRQLREPLTGHRGSVRAAVISPDSRTLAYGGTDGKVYLWDIDVSSTPRQIGQPLVAGNGTITALTFTPDGNTLAAAGSDNVVRLWDVADLSQPVAPIGQPLTGNIKPVRALDMAPDGSMLASVAGDGTARLWNLRGLADSRNTAFERACASTGGGLDRTQWNDAVPGLDYQDTCPSAPPATPSSAVNRFGEAAVARTPVDAATAGQRLPGTFADATSVADATLTGTDPIELQGVVHQVPAHAIRRFPSVDPVDKQTGALLNGPWIALRDPTETPLPRPTTAVPMGSTTDGVKQTALMRLPDNDVRIYLRINPATLTGGRQRTIDVYAAATLRLIGTTQQAVMLHYAGSWTVGIGPDGQAALLDTRHPDQLDHPIPDTTTLVPR
jgi:WD40 repeat protein